MNPLEAAIREVCKHIGADPDTWAGFEDIGRIALAALLAALPEQLAEQLRPHLTAEAASPSAHPEAT